WIESAGDQLLLSAANPDLNPGATTNLVTPTSFLIRGLWTMEDQEATHALLWHENRDTRIVFPAKEGATVSVALKRINQPQNWRQEIGSSNSEMVKDFRLATSGVPLFSWQNMSESVNGYIVERAFPANGPFKPIALLDAQESEFWDSDLPPDALAYYRIRQWSSSGLGPASRSFLVHSQIAGVQAYDFLQMNSTAELRARGWTSSGIFSDRDWFFDSAGMFMIDNSTSHTAN